MRNEMLENFLESRRRELNQRVRREILRQPSIDIRYWRDNPKLHALYVRVHNSKVNGVSFQGHGGWYQYLANEHQVYSLTRGRYYDEQLHELVRKAILKERGNVFTGNWLGKQELAKLYNAVSNRKVKGKGFFGYGNWYDYIEKAHGLSSLDRKKKSNEWINAMVEAEIKRSQSMRTKDIKRNRRRFNLYNLVRTRVIRGRTFMSHGGWNEYLKKRFGYQMPRLRPGKKSTASKSRPNGAIKTRRTKR